ncbi:CLUMA_CG011119, isoform A [Clunio marinus]|uniref:CLUMA_CG011119, isoform A n=1 Tax=Clunio marinus TaxID=568069 RepID=A0A1J1IC11_9DIPT|nr:CLUMA_CG011119, isoform A [Clunio marinus]
MNLLNIDTTKELYIPTASIVISSPTKIASPHCSPKDRINFCLKVFKLLRRSIVLKFLLPIAFLVLIIMFLMAFRNSTKEVLIWMETQNSWITFFIFLLLFTIVSFPFSVGYLVLIISCGYIFSLTKGFFVAMLGANLGVLIAHQTIKNTQKRFPIHRLIKTETGRAILRVISGPRAFKVVLFARLTPIPFGLQNTIFGISSVNSFDYHTATLIGLLPAQVINVYLGSKLRSIHDVINDNHTALAGYGMFIFEAIVGVSLMMWVIHKAKGELAAALLDSIDVDEKLLIEVDV